MKRWAPRLALRKRLKVIRKWPKMNMVYSEHKSNQTRENEGLLDQTIRSDSFTSFARVFEVFPRQAFQYSSLFGTNIIRSLIVLKINIVITLSPCCLNFEKPFIGLNILYVLVIFCSRKENNLYTVI